jgi:tetratricopeptide (TPR) repeat protein
MFARLLLSILAICLAVPALAKPENITDGELALTPEYCVDTATIRYGTEFFNPSPRAAHWVGLMGKSFWAMHHYCWALINLRRAQMAGVTPTTRKYLLQEAISDCIFVIRNSPSNFVMLPEIYTRIGDTHVLLGDPASANEAFETARTLKPDYWPAYTRWAAVLIKLGKKPEARKLLAEGLRHAPDAKPLQEQYKQLGGNPAEIAPVAKAAPPADKADDKADAAAPADPQASAPAGR